MRIQRFIAVHAEFGILIGVSPVAGVANYYPLIWSRSAQSTDMGAITFSGTQELEQYLDGLPAPAGLVLQPVEADIHFGDAWLASQRSCILAGHRPWGPASIPGSCLYIRLPGSAVLRAADEGWQCDPVRGPNRVELSDHSVSLTHVGDDERSQRFAQTFASYASSDRAQRMARYRI